MDAGMLMGYFFAVFVYAGGLLFWPVHCLLSRNKRGRSFQSLRRIFFATAGCLVILTGGTFLVSRLQLLDYNWLPLLLVFPIVNLLSVIASGLACKPPSQRPRQ